jgi:antagonist of KipI
VIRPGLFTSIQDLGRPGRRHEGVTAGGAADAFSLRLLNLLVGNHETAAGLEFTLVGPTVRFERDTTVAVGGGKFGGLPAWQPCRIRAGTTLEFGPVTEGCRGYLAVAGGFDVPCVLDGRGLHQRAGFGGGFGRPLAAGDQLPVADENGALVSGSWRLDPRMLPLCDDPCILRVLPDADGAAFHGAAWAATYQASAKSDRMGVRLSGPPLVGEGIAERVSAAVLPGTIQVPPDGQPIVLLADAQTIGGYPRLGQVIAADLSKAAQLRPGARVRFLPVTLEVAEAALAVRERAIGWLRQGMADKKLRK